MEDIATVTAPSSAHAVYLLTVWDCDRVIKADVRYALKVCDSVETAWECAKEFICDYNDEHRRDECQWNTYPPGGEITDEECVAQTEDVHSCIQLWIEKHIIQTNKDRGTARGLNVAAP
jgi:hypothetical protein